MSSMEQQLYINGQWVPAEGGATYYVSNPFTGGMATRAAAATVGDVNLSIDAAQGAFATWASLPPSERRRHILAAAEAIEAKGKELSEAITE